MNTLIREVPEALGNLMASPCDGIHTLWDVIGRGSQPLITSAAGESELPDPEKTT